MSAMATNPDVQSALLTAGTTGAKSKFTELKDWVQKGPMALKVLCFCANAFTIFVGIFGIIGSTLSLDLFKTSTMLYVTVGAFFGTMLEVKPCLCSRKAQDKVSFWCKGLSRVSGRGLLYIILGLMELPQNQILTWISGLSMIAVGIFSLFVSRHASQKLNRMHIGLIAGHENDAEAIAAAFRKYDTDNNNSLSLAELTMVAEDLGTHFTKNEMVAIFSLLDGDRSGDVSIQEFENWWRGNKEIDYSVI